MLMRFLCELLHFATIVKAATRRTKDPFGSFRSLYLSIPIRISHARSRTLGIRALTRVHVRRLVAVMRIRRAAALTIHAHESPGRASHVPFAVITSACSSSSPCRKADVVRPLTERVGNRWQKPQRGFLPERALPPLA